MDTRKRLSAVLAAAALTLGIAGIALAEGLNPGQVGQTLGGFTGTAQECADFPLEIGDGEVGVHFVLTDPEASSGNLDATFSNPASSITGLANTAHPSTTLHWHAVITGDADTVLESASTDIDGGNLNLSHTCFPDEAPSEPPVTEEPSFEQSEEPGTEPPVTEPPVTEPPVTEPPGTEPPGTEPPGTEPPVTEPPVSPSFVQSQAGETDAPSEPDTATIGGSNQTGSPGDGSWLLLVALGLLLASIVVATPVRVKNRP